MTAKRLISIVFIFITVVLSSCGLLPKGHKIDKAYNKELTEKRIADSILTARQFNYTWFHAKCKIRMTDKESSMDFTATIRAKKDSAIWLTVSPFLGIEVARILFTKDSVFIINRINKSNDRLGYNVMRNYTDIPVSFYTIQDLLCGNTIYYQAENSLMKRQDTSLVLTSSDEKLTSSVYLNRHYYIQQMIIQSQKADYSLHIQQRDYFIPDKTPFSQNRTIELRGKENISFEVLFSKLTLNEIQSFPFPINSK